MFVKWINSLLVFSMNLFSFWIHLLSDCSLVNNPNNHEFFFKTFKSYQFSKRGEFINNGLPWYRFYGQRIKDVSDEFAVGHECKWLNINFKPRGSMHFYNFLHQGWFNLMKKNWVSDFPINSTSLKEYTNAAVIALPLFVFNEIF